MNKGLWIAMGIGLGACGGGSGTPPIEPATSAAGAVQGFMQAVADSNLVKMAALWGTASGPASKTNQPPDWKRRIVVMQAYLRNDSFRITSDLPAPDETRRAQQVEIRRQSCTWNVPFISIKTRDGSWIVTQVDLAAAGNPARTCIEAGVADTVSPN